MKILSLNTYNVTSGQVVTVDTSKNGLGDSVTEEVVIQTVDAVPFSVTASVGEYATPVKVINMSNMVVAENTNEAGIYLLITDGYNQIDVTFEGNGIAVIKELG